VKRHAENTLMPADLGRLITVRRLQLGIRIPRYIGCFQVSKSEKWNISLDRLL